MGHSIHRIEPGHVLDHRREIAAIWPDASRDRIAEILPRHAARAGFRFYGAFDDEELIGFTYGYTGAPGQWWHDRVARELGVSGSARWLGPGHFEFTELHVRGDHRRQGIGGELHDELLGGVDAPTAVLSTQTDNVAALGLYHDRGWQTIVDALDFGSGRPFAILGCDLPRP